MYVYVCMRVQLSQPLVLLYKSSATAYKPRCLYIRKQRAIRVNSNPSWGAVATTHIHAREGGRKGDVAGARQAEQQRERS